MASFTSEYAAVNFDLEVRRIIVSQAASVPDVSHVLSSAKLEDLLDAESLVYFWQAIELQFNIAMTRAQKQALPTVEHVVRYLKIRMKAEAK